MKGIGQHKPRPDPLTVDEVLGGIMVVGFTIFMVLLLFNLEA